MANEVGAWREWISGLACGLALIPSAAAHEASAACAHPPMIIRAQYVAADSGHSHGGRWRAPSLPPVGIALSGGGAWGQAHLGLLQAMADDGLHADLISGTSAGALIGGFVASGYRLDQIEAIIRGQAWNPVFRETPRTAGMSSRRDPLSPTLALGETGRRRDGEPWRWRGLVPDRPIFREFVRYFGRAGAIVDGQLDDLPVPFRAVACDLAAGEVFAPDEYPLSTIVRASIGLPIFAPVHRDGRVLVDGGVLENVPAPTARRAGAGVVIAASFLDDPETDLSSFGGIISRSYNLTVASQRQPGIDAADVAIAIDVGDASVSDFDGHIDELLAAGRRAWSEHRESVLAALWGAAATPIEVTVREVAPGPGTPTPAAEELARRLGIDRGSRKLPRVALEFELARLLMHPDWADGHLALCSDGTLELILVAEAPVAELVVDAPPELAPYLEPVLELGTRSRLPGRVIASLEDAVLSARRDGLFLAGIDDVRWDDVSGELRVRLDAGRIERVDLITSGGAELAEVPRDFALIENRIGDIEWLDRALARSEPLRGSLWHGGSRLRRLDSGGYRLSLGVEEPPHWTASWTAGLGDELGPTLQGRIAWPSRVGWTRWNTELRGAASREVVRADLTTSPPVDRALRPFARVVVAAPALRLFDASGSETDLSRFVTASASAGLRSAPSELGEFEIALTERLYSADSFFPERGEGGDDLALDALWLGRARDDRHEPRFEAAWALGGTLPLAGDDTAWSGIGDVALTTRLGRRGRTEVSLLGRVTEAGDSDPLPTDRWSDPGAWWLAPGLDAGRGRARSVRRATLALRQALGDYFGFNVTGGISAAGWRLDEQRLDAALPDHGEGVSLFVEASTARLGPVMVGIGWSGDIDEDRFFVLWSPARVDWPGPPGAGPTGFER
jgi:predicted acylesterase/phospholipase RssA